MHRERINFTRLLSCVNLLWDLLPVVAFFFFLTIIYWIWHPSKDEYMILTDARVGKVILLFKDNMKSLGREGAVPCQLLLKM